MQGVDDATARALGRDPGSMGLDGVSYDLIHTCLMVELCFAIVFLSFAIKNYNHFIDLKILIALLSVYCLICLSLFSCFYLQCNLIVLGYFFFVLFKSFLLLFSFFFFCLNFPCCYRISLPPSQIVNYPSVSPFPLRYFCDSYHKLS